MPRAGSVPIDSDFDLFYRPAPEKTAPHELAIDEGEAEIGFYEDGGMELADVTPRARPAVAADAADLHDDCQGICPQCGQNRNTGHCKCETKLVDERWAALRDLKFGTPKRRSQYLKETKCRIRNVDTPSGGPPPAARTIPCACPASRSARTATSPNCLTAPARSAANTRAAKSSKSPKSSPTLGAASVYADDCRRRDGR